MPLPAPFSPALRAAGSGPHTRRKAHESHGRPRGTPRQAGGGAKHREIGDAGDAPSARGRGAPRALSSFRPARQSVRAAGAAAAWRPDGAEPDRRRDGRRVRAGGAFGGEGGVAALPRAAPPPAPPTTTPRPTTH